MTYQECIDYLFTATPAFERDGAKAYKPGLQTTEALDAYFGHPHRTYVAIHVAGTNGKGSVSHTMAAILQTAGYRVGLYTSPHLVDFRERIRVNGCPIPEEKVVSFVENHRDFFEPLHPSFFELTTALALKYFEEQHADIAVIEVGLGGRLDSTNIITPILSVITNISLDHTQFLGNTLKEIAAEKAGIIKPQVPVVIGETTPETRMVFEQKARETGSEILFAEEHPQPRKEWQEAFELKGSYQKKNLRTILCATNFLKESGRTERLMPLNDILRASLPHVCRLTGLHGRWETLQEHPHVVCDTGHNLAGWNDLAPQISAQPCKALHIVFGMVDDKDLEGVMRLLPGKARYYFTQAGTHRAVPAEKVARTGASFHLEGDAYPTVIEAYRDALSKASEEDFVFIGGSSYVVADLLTALQQPQLPHDTL
ncbi:MAG: bifunctional folylpolyglutamate synthase/dihydrofolate synthase [Prevotella sp.]|nr:bifunctional folylpolyglutamate synthase/dihydrofolate synthase [Prevotella sp.]